MRASRVATAARVLAALAVVATGSLAVPDAATAEQQPLDGPTIALVSATPWVEPDGTWTARFRVTGAPAGTTLDYSIHQRVGGSETTARKELRSDRTTPPSGGVLLRGEATPLESVTDSAGITTLELPIRSKRTGVRTRALIPDAGTYPVVVDIDAPGDAADAATTVYLNRLPARDDRPAGPFRLAVIVQPDLGLSFDERGEPAVTDDLRSSISSTTELLTHGGGLELTVAIRPDALVALSQSGDPADAQLVDRLRRSLGESDVLRLPWADLHLEGWSTTGEINRVQASVLDGHEALAAALLVQPDPRTWPPDPTVGPASVATFGRVGATTLVAETDQLSSARTPAGESGFTRPIRIAGVGDAAVRGVTVDPDLQALLDAASDSPAMSVHQMVTLMFATWLSDDHERGTVVRVGPRAQPDVSTSLLELLRSSNPGPESTAPIEVVTPDAVGALPPIVVRQSGKDVEWTRTLVAPDATPRVGSVSRRLGAVRPLADDYASVMPAADPESVRQANVVRRSLDRRVTATAQADLLREAETQMRADLAKITVSRPRSLTVTSRRTALPLRFTNGTGRPVKVRMHLESPKVEFVDGDEQTLELAPGLNRLDVDVEVRTSGQFVVRVTLTPPGSDRVLASTRQQIRSRTFSGVGLMLSGGALLFLVVWWSRTLRRRPGRGPGEAGSVA